MKEIKTDKMDRISHLPDSIIHHLLGFLDDPKTLVRMSVVSKNWSSLTASFPILKFHYSNLKENIFKYINYTTDRLRQQNVVTPHTLDICTSIRKPAEMDIIDKCIKLVLKKGVQVLVLNVPYYESDLYMYCLPDSLLSVSSLLSLTLNQCALPFSLMVDTFKLTSLKSLSLRQVPIDNEKITYLTTSCPLLEEVNLEYTCGYRYGFKRFCVYAHKNLQTVKIKCWYQIEKIDIDAPNLRYLLLDAKNLEETSMNLASCKKLETFCYYGIVLEPFLDFISSLVFLKNLLLCSRDKCRLSFPSLRSLVLQSSCELDEIDINAPNLLMVDLSGHFSGNSDVHRSKLIENKDSFDPTAFMGENSFLYVDASWFEKLRFFLKKYQGIEVLKLHICVAKDGINLNELMVFRSQPYELKHLQVALYNLKDLQAFKDVVDALLWCCRSPSLTLQLEGEFIKSENETQRRHKLQYPYEKLLKQEDQDQIIVRIVLARYPYPKQHFTDLNSLVEALRDAATYSTYTITFIKEKKAVKEARKWNDRHMKISTLNDPSDYINLSMKM